MIRHTAPSTPTPLASVVIPSYYHEAYIEAAVSSVLNQTCVNMELIVIDDGSKDRSLRLLNRFRDRRLKVVAQGNSGAHVAINRGLELAAGTYLSILNSDDIFLPSRFERMIDQMQRQAADFSCSWLQQIDHEGRPGSVKRGWESGLPSWAAGLQKFKVHEPDTFAYELLRTNFVSTTSNMIFSRALYERVGGMRNLRFTHDWDFAFRAVASGKCIMIPESLLQYRTHGANTISSNRAWMLFEVSWVLARHLPALEQQLSYIAPDVIEHSHYGASDPLYHVLRKRFEEQSDIPDDDIGRDLLDDANLRQPFIDMIER